MVSVPFGAESRVAQDALGAVLLDDDFVTSMRARFSLLGRDRFSRWIGGEGVAQVAQTDNTLFRHAETTSGECAGARAAVVACNCRCCRREGGGRESRM